MSEPNLNDFLQCSTCPPEDHESVFCRCESRNIRIAKQRRKMGLSTWNKNFERASDQQETEK